jgi:hypothetical protein
MSNCYCHTGKAGGSPFWMRVAVGILVGEYATCAPGLGAVDGLNRYACPPYSGPSRLENDEVIQ